MVLYESLLIASQLLLSAYPLLIKLVDASVLFQTGLRMLIYTLLATVAANATGTPILLGTLFSYESIYTGLINLLHVGSSYTAFDQLASGNAIALFYTYPIWNILAAAIYLKETIPISSLPWIGLALLGTILLAQPSPHNWTVIGVIAALVAALTETAIYVWFKKDKNDKNEVEEKDKKEEKEPWTKMIQMFGSSGLIWIIGVVALLSLGFLHSKVFRISPNGLISIVVFNALIGFVGYALRFYLIPKVSTIVFSALSFVGVVAAYGLGWVFMNEVPTIVQALGAVAIIVANTVLLRREVV